MWDFFASDLGMGMGIGLIVSSVLTKALFSPAVIYSVTHIFFVVNEIINVANYRY